MAAVDFVELRLEETPVYEGANTAAAPYRLSTDKLYLPARAARLGPGVSHLDRSDELRGLLGALPRLVETYDPDGSLSVRAYARTLTWLFSLAGLVGTHTAGDGIITDPDLVPIPLNAHRWVFTKRDSITAQTAQVITNFKDENLSLKGNGYALSSLALNAPGEVTGDLMGLVLKRLAVDAATVPVYPAGSILPFRRGDLFLTWLGSAGVAADFSLAIANSLERVRSMSLATPSFYPDLMEYGDEYPTLTGSIPMRTLAAADMDALLAATTFSAKARWKSLVSIGATAYKYSLWVEMPSCQYVGGNPEDLGNKRRIGASYDFFAAHDEAAGYDFKVTLVNAETTIATYV